MKAETFAHSVTKCSGIPSQAEVKDVTIALPYIGWAKVPTARFLQCDVCQTAYFIEGFDDELESSLAHWLRGRGEPLTEQEKSFLHLMGQEQLSPGPYKTWTKVPLKKEGTEEYSERALYVAEM